MPRIFAADSDDGRGLGEAGRARAHFFTSLLVAHLGVAAAEHLAERGAHLAAVLAAGARSDAGPGAETAFASAAYVEFEVGDLLAVIERLQASGQTMIIVEQSLNVAMAIADRAVFIEKGHVRFDGPTRELSERDDIARAVFLGGRDTRDDHTAKDESQ